MLKLSDLTLRPDFQLGPMLVSPPRRLVQGPGGDVHVEPLIMQVFLMLLDARGQVVTRNDLFDQCWGGAYVGDDSLNRAIAKVRGIGAQVAPGLFDIETIPRTGYRLRGDILASEPALPGQSEECSRSRFSRRMMLGSAAAAGVAAVGGIGLWSVRFSEDRRFDALMARAVQALRYGSPSGYGEPIDYLRSAVALRPDDAKAQGLLAFARAMVAEHGDPREAGGAAQAAEETARTALALDPKEPNARLAMVLVQRSVLDLAATELRLREILATAPNNTIVMRRLWDLLQSTGQSRAARALNERAIALDPFAAANNFPRAQLLWILGQNAEADRVIDRAMLYWPEHQWVRFARFTIYAFTDRPRAALAMLDNENMRPQHFTPAGIAAWRVSLAALDQRSPTSIAAARTANLELVRQAPALASQAVLTLSALGDVDTAFDIANDLLLFRRAVEPRPRASSARPTVKSTGWRFTPWLFTPPAEAMQADPRFNSLCDGIGLTEYWAKRGVKPDYQLRLT